MNRNTKTVTKNSTTVRKKRVYTEVVGLFLRVRMRDFCDGYTIFDIREGDHVITCTGNILVPKARMMVRVMGEWTDTAYGRQLQNCTLRELLADAKSIYEYLLKVPGVGPNIATAVSENIEMSLPDLIRQDDPVKTLIHKSFPPLSCLARLRICSLNNLSNILNCRGTYFDFFPLSNFFFFFTLTF